jgi:N-glycosidase YbiA
MGGSATVDGKEYKCMDNFYECSFVLYDLEYSSSENYFQSTKATNRYDHEKIRKMGAGYGCYFMGGQIKIREDWEKIKVDVMYRANKAKYEQNEELTKELVATESEIVFGGSTSFWDRWNGLFYRNQKD